jgi:hypothetical protein
MALAFNRENTWDVGQRIHVAGTFTASPSVKPLMNTM